MRYKLLSIEESSEYKTSTISFKTIATQKAEYTKIAKSHDLPTGEWVRSIVDIHKHMYWKVGDPSSTFLP